MSLSNLVVQKRSISIAGHRTSISLEAPFWDALKEVAAKRGRSVQALVSEIDRGRGENNLSSAIRIAVLRAAVSGELALLPGGQCSNAARQIC